MAGNEISEYTTNVKIIMRGTTCPFGYDIGEDYVFSNSREA